jgi:ATP-binding cassette subfamily B protein
LLEILRALRQDGLTGPGLLIGAIVATAIAGAIEVLVLRGLLGVAVHLGTPQHRVSAMGVLGVLFAALLAVEVSSISCILRMGRRLEVRLREAFLRKIPRLNDRYFATRPASDMSYRAHAIQVLRAVPQLGVRVLRSGADLIVASLGIVWIDPQSWPFVLATGLACILLPFAAQRSLTERDSRVRAFDGTLTRYFLDALLGLMPLRTHGAERSLRREHEGMLAEFRRAFLELLSTSTIVDGVMALVSAAVAVGLLVQYLGRGGEPAGSLLLVYWALSLPATGADLAGALRQYPELRNTIERLLEPLGALEDGDACGDRVTASAADEAAVEIRFSSVEVRAAGKKILEDVSLSIPRGAHVAVVGPSGAGKSSLCALLMGWHRAARGDVLVDGTPLRGGHLDALREATAWVDPAIALWNRSLIENVEYGTLEPAGSLSPIIDAAELLGILQQLPDGMQTRLGDGGALVSGGEGQRVRLARAMMRPNSRLVLLDEPFRGLDRDKRRLLLGRARAYWKNATLLCVTHDVGETLDFERVIVVDGGRVVEDGAPRDLAGASGSRYRAMLEAERGVREQLWQSQEWRRITLRDGIVVDGQDGNGR